MIAWLGQRRISNLLVDPKFAFSAPPPEQKLLPTIRAPQLRGGIEQCAENRGAVVIGEFDQSGLRDQAAKLDQLTCSFASLHDPGPGISPRAAEFETVSRHCHPTQRR
ncbi:hypothetical protein GCM10009087_30970 [Sphingomonas oligophenolica]